MVPGASAWLKRYIRDVPDHPEPGIVFRDITPLLADPQAFGWAVEHLAEPFAARPPDKVAGVEARGFVLAAPVAHRLGAGFVPIRKAGKLPAEIEHESYELEYGTDLLEIHRDAIVAGERVLICDDLVATGGTAAAALRLVRRLGGEVVGLAVLVELAFLSGRATLEGLEVHSLVTYEEP